MLALRLYWTGDARRHRRPARPGARGLRARGLRLVSIPVVAGALARAKSTSYAENMAAQDAAVAAGADDALLVGDDGTVLEAPTANIWWREGDPLFTPSLDLPILAGVTRALLLESRASARPSRASSRSTGCSRPTRCSSAPRSAR